MSNNFGYIDIILLAMIAGFIILRLRNILGRKTGHENKAYGAFDEKKFERFKNEDLKQEKFNDAGLEGEQKEKFLKGAEIAYETIITDFSELEQIFPILEIFIPKDLAVILIILEFDELAVKRI